LPGEPKRLDHPPVVYLLALIFSAMTILVMAGVLYHLTFSPHGPAVLKPLKDRIYKKQKSAILDDAKLLEELEVHRHFHNIVEHPQLPENERPVCFICHSDYPHSKSKKVRALLNMHTQFFVCETCHIEENKEKGIFYKWYNPYAENPTGPFFGTSYDSETGNLAEVDDKISKISPYFIKGAIIESAIQVQEAPLAQDYMNVRDQLTPEQRDGVKKKFHVNIKPKGHECKECHAEKGILDFKKLGFTSNRTVDLEQLNVSGMITKYETFYLPNLFKE
jgi:hypothetical protein